MNKKVFAWALFDFAGTIFSMNVVSFYFPLLVSIDLALGDFWVGFANSASMLLTAISLPILATYSDLRGGKMPFLFFATMLMILGTIGIAFSAKMGLPTFVIGFFIIANLSYQVAMGFYNAFLDKVSSQQSRGKISGVGAAFGYLGSIAGLIIVSPFNTGKFFGFTLRFLANSHGRASTFLPTAILVFVFSLPMFFVLWEWDFRKTGISFKKYIYASIERVRKAITSAHFFPEARRLLIAKFFYEEGTQTAVIFMGIYADKVMGFSDEFKVLFFIVATTGAVIGSLLSGFLTDRLNPKRTLSGTLIGWVLALIFLVFAKSRAQFVVVGTCVGMLLGSVWTSSRPFLIWLVPRKMLGQFFGLYGLVGKAAAVIGPIVWVTVLRISAPLGSKLSYKLAVLSLAFLIFIGLIILRGVRVDDQARSPY